LVSEETEETESTVAKKEKSFPTGIVVGLGILIMVLSAVTGMICLRGREKTNAQQSAVQEEQQAEQPAQSIEQNLTNNAERNPEQPEGATSESGSNGKNSEWTLPEVDDLKQTN
jgi:flagellar basal body-associated protein FliL